MEINEGQFHSARGMNVLSFSAFCPCQINHGVLLRKRGSMHCGRGKE